MQYKVLIADFSSELEKIVNAHILDGWTPQGGVAVCSTTSEDEDSPRRSMKTDYTFTQAMILRD